MKTPPAPALVRVGLLQLFQKERPVRKPGQGVDLGKLQHALVRQCDLARVTAGETEIDDHEYGDDQSGGQHDQGAVVPRGQSATGGGNGLHLPVGIADPERARPARPCREGLHRLRRLRRR